MTLGKILWVLKKTNANDKPLSSEDALGSSFFLVLVHPTTLSSLTRRVKFIGISS